MKVESFNQPLNNWNVSNVINMGFMFGNTTSFNQPLNNWNVSNVTNMYSMFSYATNFNQDISNWDVSNVTNMAYVFREAKNFNQPLNNWNVSNVTTMNRMFLNARNFNQPLNNWNVSSVTDMGYMFAHVWFFNQPLNNWNVQNVTTMEGMFREAKRFNQPLNNWDVQNVTNTHSMFRKSYVFNQPINNWNVSKVTNMYAMFSQATNFNQNIRMWNTTTVISMAYMFYGNSMYYTYSGVPGFGFGNNPTQSFFNQGYTHNGSKFTKPAFKILPATTATEDSLYSHQVVIVDDLSYIQPAPTIDIALTQSSPDWLSITNNTLSGTPLQAQVGQLNQVTLETYISGHQDVPNAKVTKTFNISVANVNDNPVVNVGTLSNAEEDVLFEHTINVTDEDPGDIANVTLTIHSINGSTDTNVINTHWLQITKVSDGQFKLSGTPTENEIGTYDIILKASDNTTPSPGITNKTIQVVVNEPVLSKDTTTGIVKLNSFYYTTDTDGNNPTIKSEYNYMLHTDDLNPVEHQIPGDSTKYRIINDKNKISDEFKGDSTAVDYNYVTTLVTDMNDLFKDKIGFNRNITSWDVSKVTSMQKNVHKCSSF